MHMQAGSEIIGSNPVMSFYDTQRQCTTQPQTTVVHVQRQLGACSEWEKEHAADAVLFRNTFGTQPKKPLGPIQNAFDLVLKNPANTNVVLWGNRLLALWEVSCSWLHS